MPNEVLNNSNMKGELELKIYKDGKLIETFKEHNLIVSSSCDIIGLALSGHYNSELANNFAINQIAWGDTRDAGLSLTTQCLAGNYYRRPIEGHYVSGSVDPDTSGSNVLDTTDGVKLIINFKIGKSENAIGQIRQFGLLRDIDPITDTGTASTSNPIDYGKGKFFSIINKFTDNNYIYKDNTVDIAGTWTITILNSSSN